MTKYEVDSKCAVLYRRETTSSKTW